MISNLKDLENVINSYIVKALELTRDEIHEVLWQKVADYYSEPVFNNELDPTEPLYYRRTELLMNSLTASHIKNDGDFYYFDVGWDEDYLRFRYPLSTMNRYGREYSRPKGQQVLEWFNSSSHGGTVDGEHNYFDEALEELGNEQGIINLFKQNCKKVGLPIK